MKKMILLVVILALVLPGCTPYSQLVPQTPEDLVDVVMYVVSGGSSQEPLILGPDGAPTGLQAPTGLAAGICAQLSYEVVSLTQEQTTAQAVLQITAPDAVELIHQALEGMETYEEGTFTENFEALLAQSPQMKTFPVTLELVQVDGKWCMKPNAQFSNAITGGLMEKYNEIQQALVDKMTEGGAQ